MPISGLIITLESGTVAGDLALATLSNHPRIQLGSTDGPRYPAVLDTASESENKRWWRWLTDMPGVRFVDVVNVHFEDDDADAAQPQHDRASKVAVLERSR